MRADKRGEQGDSVHALVVIRSKKKYVKEKGGKRRKEPNKQTQTHQELLRKLEGNIVSLLGTQYLGLELRTGGGGRGLLLNDSQRHFFFCPLLYLRMMGQTWRQNLHTWGCDNHCDLTFERNKYNLTDVVHVHVLILRRRNVAALILALS